MTEQESQRYDYEAGRTPDTDPDAQPEHASQAARIAELEGRVTFWKDAYEGAVELGQKERDVIATLRAQAERDAAVLKALEAHLQAVERSDAVFDSDPEEVGEWTRRMTAAHIETKETWKAVLEAVRARREAV